MHRPAPLALLFALAAVGCGCSNPNDAPPPLEASGEAAAPTPTGDTDYDRAVRDLDARIAAAERAAERFDDDWGRLDTVAALYAARAQLTGDYADYRRAEEALSRAFELAAEGSGPLLTRASLHFTLHRLDRTAADLDRIEAGVILSDTTKIAVDHLRGDVAFHSGRYEEAERLHRRADETWESSSGAFRIAYDLWQTGRFMEAESWLVTSLGRIVGDADQGRAWTHLQMGIMDLDRGRWDEALAHYRDAQAVFSGWWLVDEHVAEIHALREDWRRAEVAYRDVVARTDSPELMDALADVLLERGRDEEAAEWRARARATYEAQLETLPEAAYGHALDHFLAHGEAARALELAEANHALRPGGEATVKLAQALLRAGRVDDARTRIEGALATAYRTAELHATAAAIYRASGDTAAAQAQDALAGEIDPHAPGGMDWLLPGE